MHPDSLVERFRRESRNIAGYVSTVSRQTPVSDSEYIAMNKDLRKLGITPFPVRPLSRQRCDHSQEELLNLRQLIQDKWSELNPLVKDSVEDEEDPFGCLPPDEFDLASEWHLRLSSMNLPPLDELNIREFVEAQYTMRLESGAECDFDESVEKDIIERALKLSDLNRRLRKMTMVNDLFGRLSMQAFAIRIRLSDAEINIFRQGFILLLTAFDAAVFDIIRLALEKDFFRLIGYFGSGEKLSLGQLREWGSVERMIRSVTEQQLKRLYLRDLLNILSSDLRVTFMPDGIDELELYEIVGRRNLHVHNRGIVDQRFLDLGCNVHGLALGALATVDACYLEKVIRICTGAIERIAAWVMSRGFGNEDPTVAS